MGTFTIRLDNLRFYSHHGVFSHETRDGNEFEVNLSVEYPDKMTVPGNEDLECSISYVHLYEMIKISMAAPRQLLETVAKEIVTNIKEKFPDSLAIECRITKLHVPLAGMMGSATVSYSL